MNTADPTAAPPAVSPVVAEGDTGRAPRRFDIDLLRVVASVAVVFLHASGLLIPAIKDPDGGWAHWIALAGDTFGRFAVPAFFAMAGWAVLVASPPRSDRVLVRRVVRILVPMAIWTLAYVAWARILVPQDNVDPVGPELLDAALGSIRPAFHLWYLYSYVPILILLGATSLIVARKRLGLAGILLLVAAVLPTCGIPITALTGVKLPPVAWTPAFYQIVYAVGGAFLLTRPVTGRRWPWALVAALGFAGVLWWGHAVHYPSPYGNIPVAVFTAGMLLLLSGVRVPESIRGVVGKLSEASFGVYLVHLILLQAMLRWVGPIPAGGRSAILYLLLVAVVVVVGAFALSLLWGRLKLRRFLG